MSGKSGGDDAGDELLDGIAIAKVRRIGGDALLAQLIDMFLEHAPARVAAALAGQRSGDLAQVERATHSLKSTAGNLGAMRLMRVAERIEAEAAARDEAAVTALLGPMETAFEATRIALLGEREGLGP